jgi:polyisoprenyl-teichoic acid--peptidoglycan teichoic acid transferase
VVKKQMQLSRKTIFGRIALALLVAVLAVGAGLAAYTVTRRAAAAAYNYQPALPTLVETTPTLSASQSPNAPAGSEATEILPKPVNLDPTVVAPSLKPWDGAGRVTILLLGLDFRDWQAQKDYSRSDTMILLTMDPAAKTAGILSIPRDMWVAIPGFQHGKINTAYYLGEAYKLPGGGPALATKTVESFLGVPINYYAQIDFGAFVKFIDDIGGVKIDVPSPITIDMLGAGGGVKTKKTLLPGRQVLPGEWALAYARARYTEDGDFDRARRQQQVIMGIRDRMLSADMLTTIIQKAPELYRQLAAGIHTNLQLDDVIRLALAAREIKNENIQNVVLGKESVLFGTSPDNLSILVPIPDKIHVLRDKVFTTSGSLLPATSGDTRQKMQSEAARLAIYNGSQDGSMAQRAADFLKAQGANVVQAEAADKAYTATTIIDHSGSPFTLQYLSELIGSQSLRIISEYDPTSQVDVELYIGSDWANNNSLP